MRSEKGKGHIVLAGGEWLISPLPTSGDLLQGSNPALRNVGQGPGGNPAPIRAGAWHTPSGVGCLCGYGVPSSAWRYDVTPQPGGTENVIRRD